MNETPIYDELVRERGAWATFRGIYDDRLDRLRALDEMWQR